MERKEILTLRRLRTKDPKSYYTMDAYHTSQRRDLSLNAPTMSPLSYYGSSTPLGTKRMILKTHNTLPILTEAGYPAMGTTYTPPITWTLEL